MPNFNPLAFTLIVAMAVCSVGCGTDPGPGAPFYGDQGNERILPAEGNGKLPLRARKEMAFYRLKNPRKGDRKFGKESLSVDWEVSKTGDPQQQVCIVIHPAKEPPQVVNVSSDFRNARQGTISLEVAWGFGRMADVPTNVEFYLVVRDYRVNDLQFKVSNSVTLGSADYTYARNWSQEELDRISRVWPLSGSPPAGGPAVASPAASQRPLPVPSSDIGVDTEWLGDSTGGTSQRMAQIDNPLLGFKYAMGDWAGGPCLSTLIPIYSLDSAGENQKQLTAGPGFVVGGLHVNADKVVRGVQLVFMKLKDDGTLDSQNTYTSEWAGVATDSPRKLGGDGRRMLGVHLRQGLIVDAMAAVMEKKE